MSFRHDDNGFYPGQPVEWDGLDGHVGSGQFMWWAEDIDGLKAITRTPNNGCFSIPPGIIRPVEREPRVGDVVSFDYGDEPRMTGVIVAAVSVGWRVRVDRGTATGEHATVTPSMNVQFAASAMP